ncbi:MAG: hypothetical protein LBT13_04960 [Treponema sp.]|jgi:hypothetical protein|nr:hypothetical protein [Treponema sp.]
MGYFRCRVVPLHVLYGLVLLLWGTIPLWSQQQNGDTSPQVQADPAGDRDPSSMIGLTLEALYSRFGIPRSVYAVRGIEVWQDDVVLVYDQGDFYVYKDRVWQIGVKDAYGITLGEKRTVVSSMLGEGMRNFEDHILFPLPNRGWPLMLRINFEDVSNSEARVSAIFIYRPDF